MTFWELLIVIGVMVVFAIPTVLVWMKDAVERR